MGFKLLASILKPPEKVSNFINHLECAEPLESLQCCGTVVVNMEDTDRLELEDNQKTRDTICEIFYLDEDDDTEADRLISSFVYEEEDHENQENQSGFDDVGFMDNDLALDDILLCLDDMEDDLGHLPPDFSVKVRFHKKQFMNIKRTRPGF